MTLGEVLPESFPNWERPLNLIQLILAEEMEQLKRSGLYSDRDEAFLFGMERKMKIRNYSILHFLILPVKLLEVIWKLFLLTRNLMS